MIFDFKNKAWIFVIPIFTIIRQLFSNFNAWTDNVLIIPTLFAKIFKSFSFFDGSIISIVSFYSS